MSAAFVMGEIPGGCAIYPVPATRGRQYSNEGGYLSAARLATDAIGTFLLTLTNVVVGSAIQVEDQLGTTTLYNGVAATTSPLITLNAYAPGSTLNDLRIKVRKGTSAPYYQPYETLSTAIAGAQSIFVSQTVDG